MRQKINNKPASPTMRDEKGFTLLELLIGMAIFAIGTLAIAGLQTHSVNTNTNARRNLEVETVVGRIVEDIKDLAWNDADGDDIIDNFDVDGDGAIDQLWVTDADGDGLAGMDDVGVVAAGTGGADHVVGSLNSRIGLTHGTYQFSINVAPAPIGAPDENTLVINVIAEWNQQGQRRNYSVLFVKARDV